MTGIVEVVGLEDEPEEINPPAAVAANATDRAIEEHFETGRLRVVQEKNELFLPHVVDFIVKDKWGNLRPEYQRRLRWDDAKKSRLIAYSVFRLAARRTALSSRVPLLESAPVSEKRVGLNRSPCRRGYGR